MVFFRTVFLSAILTGLTLPLSAQSSNWKKVLEGDTLTPSQIENGDAIVYWIRFQNTSSDTFNTIIVSDTLDPRLDLSSFEMIDSSHPCEVQRDDSPVIRWVFEDVRLPDSITAGAASIGYVIFRIRPVEFIAPGQTIPNRARIDFDLTASALTAYALVEIKDDINKTDDPAGIALQYAVVPNPNTGAFAVQASAAAGPTGFDLPAQPTSADRSRCWVTDMAGRTVWSGYSDAVTPVQLDHPQPGLYWLWVETGEKRQCSQFMVAR
jgi:uncharacterized repeat protein (TIGR01451 family)